MLYPALFCFLFGLVLGSFFNVCISRVPYNTMLDGSRSKCPHCDNILKWYHNIPIISYVFLKGRCAFCKGVISLRYPAIEILTGILFFFVFIKFGLSFAAFYYAVFVSLLLVLTFVDIDHRILPDILTLPGILLGVVGAITMPGHDILDSLLGAAVGGGAILLLAYLYLFLRDREGMGLGDAKLLAMIGAFMGLEALLPVFGAATVLALCDIGVAMLVSRSSVDKDGGGHSGLIPFGPFLAAGTLLCIFWGASKVSELLFPYLKYFG